MSRHALPYLAVARVTGADAATFLHAQLSADVAAIGDGAAGFACYCSPRGQVFGLLLVCRRDPGFLLVGSSALLPGMLERLRLFVLRARVDLALADELEVVGLNQAADAVAGETVSGAADLAYVIARREEAAGGTAGATAWKSSELQHGVVWLAPATSERFIPQMLGFDRIGAVSFTKGCYPGQEIIARARYLGKVKRRPLRLRAERTGALDVPEPGEAIRLVAGAERLEATLIDSAIEPGSDRLVVFVVAPETENAVQAVEIDGRDYRCATM